MTVTVSQAAIGEWNVTGSAQNYADNAASDTHFYFSDHLGTVTLIANLSGGIESSSEFDPYGIEVDTNSWDANHYKFTGKERDSESGLDYFGARYYGSSMGRFMSPDPSGLVFASFANPQSLNLYSYVHNNPLSLTDPTGLDCAYLNSSGGYDHMDQTISSGGCTTSGGYWVDGGLQNVQINSQNNTITLTGITGADGSGTSTASYQIQTNVFVDEWSNTMLNPFDHLTIGLQGQWPVGQNPKSDASFMMGSLTDAFNGVNATYVPGKVSPEQQGGKLLQWAKIPVTGPQANAIQAEINAGIMNPPNYSLNPSLGLDCVTWVQSVLFNAGIATGPPQPFPNEFMNQLSNMFPVNPGVTPP